MTTYNWEQGAWHLPEDGFAHVMAGLIAKETERRMRWAALVEQAQAALRRVMASRGEGCLYRSVFNSLRLAEGTDQLAQAISQEGEWCIHAAILTTGDDGVVRLTAEPLARIMAGSASESDEHVTLRAGEATITLRRSLSEVEWVVPSNNQAVRTARKHELGQKLFELLEQVNWREGTGGVIHGGNEHERHAADRLVRGYGA